MTTPTTVQVRLQIRADTAANWTSFSPVLLANELGLETDTKKFKIGDGNTSWQSLAYFPSIVSGGTVLGNLEIGTTGTLTFEGSTANGFETTLGVVDPTADRTILLPNQSGTVVVGGNASIVDADIAANAEIAVSKLADGAARQLLQTDAAGTGVEWTSNIDIPGTLDVTGAATFDGAVTVAGDLTVNGTTTTISTQNLLVEDKNIILGDVATPTDVTADGGGITLKGATDKTINWIDSTDAWTSSERFSVPLGSAAAPSLTFTGDPNTGIYSPGADQVAISTNGTGRLFVDASGNVGVGGTPVDSFHVITTGNTNFSVERNADSATSPNIAFKTSRGTYLSPTALINGDGIGTIQFRGYTGTTSSTGVGLRALVNGTPSGSRCPADFVVLTDNGTVFGERLRLTSAGLLGVGVSSPSVLLQSQQTSAGASVIGASVVNNSVTAGTGVILDLTPSTAGPGVRGAQIEAVNTDGFNEISLALKTSSNGNPPATRLHITPAGRVGIGDNAPGTFDVRGAKLTLADSTSDGIGIKGRRDSLDRWYVGYNSSDQLEINQIRNNALAFKTNNAEVARLTNSGQLLVGTFSAVTGSNTQYGKLQVLGNTAGSTSDGRLVIGRGEAVASSGIGIGQICFTDNTAGEFARIVCESDAASGANDYPGRLVFSTTADGASSPTERMRIRSDGKIQIGGTGITDARLNVVTSASERLGQFISQNTGGDAATFGLYIGKYSNDSTTTQRFIGFSINNDGSGCGQINANGSGQAAFGTFSDQRLKENIQDLPSQLGLIKALRPVEFDFKDGNGHQLGFIAQEMQQVYPDVVSEQDGYLTITGFGKTECRLIKALQEAVAKIETLEAKVAALESA